MPTVKPTVEKGMLTGMRLLRSARPRHRMPNHVLIQCSPVDSYGFHDGLRAPTWPAAVALGPKGGVIESRSSYTVWQRTCRAIASKRKDTHSYVMPCVHEHERRKTSKSSSLQMACLHATITCISTRHSIINLPSSKRHCAPC